MRITHVISSELIRLLLIIRFLALENKPFRVLIIRKAEEDGFFHDRARGTSCL